MSQKVQLYVRRGSKDFSITNDASTDIRKALPVGVYRLSNVPFVGWVFERIDDFKMPSKFYGNLESQGDRILTTYNIRYEEGHSTGVLLRGDKGSGKTLLAKKVAMDSGLPVVVVNSPFSDDSFKELIAGLGKCVVIFDEFEKVYENKSSQNDLLTMFDGVFSVSALMFIIVNESSALVGPLLNRPGRLYYALDYNGLEREFIEDYCEDRLKNKDNKLGVLSVATMFDSFNFDMLQALVQEMNRFNETATESVKYLNISSGYFKSHMRYSVTAVVLETGRQLVLNKSDRETTGHPLRSRRYFSYFEDSDGDNPEICYEFKLDEETMVSIDPEKDQFVFQSHGVRVTLSKIDYTNSFSLGGTTRHRYNPDEHSDVSHTLNAMSKRPALQGEDVRPMKLTMGEGSEFI